MKQILLIITSLFVFTSSDAQENKTNTINSDKEESLTMEAKHIETVVSFFTAVAAADADAFGAPEIVSFDVLRIDDDGLISFFC